MKIGIVKEQDDNRIAIIPDHAKQLIESGHEVFVEKGAGELAFFYDHAYENAGCKIDTRKKVLDQAALLINITPVPEKDLQSLNPPVSYVSQFKPFATDQHLNHLQATKISAFSLDMIPRITIAQAMDVLSSMASIAGYKAVLEAANLMPRYFPMLTTAAGSIPPSKVLVLGAGVAGLQAIATAKRLGAVVEAFDTRAAAKEEVQSLGAKFVEVEGAKDDAAAGGYAVEQTEEYKEKQRALIHDRVMKSDVVITTAQLRGKPAPTLITKAMVEAMKPGSVIVDLASSTGGNCELTKDRETVEHNKVYIIGNSELAAKVPQHASQLFSKNIMNYLGVVIKEGNVNFDMENEIIKSSCIVKEGEILYGKQN